MQASTQVAWYNVELITGQNGHKLANTLLRMSADYRW